MGDNCHSDLISDTSVRQDNIISIAVLDWRRIDEPAEYYALEQINVHNLFPISG